MIPRCRVSREEPQAAACSQSSAALPCILMELPCLGSELLCGCGSPIDLPVNTLQPMKCRHGLAKVLAKLRQHHVRPALRAVVVVQLAGLNIVPGTRESNWEEERYTFERLPSYPSHQL